MAPRLARLGRRSFATILAGLALLAVGAAAVTAMWWLRAREKPLEPGWIALVWTLAGDGRRDVADGPPERARFSEPFGVAVASGTVYVSDAGDSHRLRRIGPDGHVATLAGGGAGFADGAGATAKFRTPSGLAVDAAGRVIVADTGNHAIRRIAPDGTVTTIAGDGTPGYRDGPVGLSQFNGPIGVAADASGRVIVADTYNDRVRAILPDGRAPTLAGSGTPGWRDGPASVAQFDTPSDVAVDAAGTIYVADTGNDAVRVISANGDVTTLVSVADAPALGLRRPTGIDVSPAGSVYVVDANGVVEVALGSAPRRLAGSTPGFADDRGEWARFREPTGVAWAAEGRLIVADSVNALVRVVARADRVELRPPVSPSVAPRFDEQHFAWLPLLWPVDPMAGPHEIAGTLGEARGEAGGEGPERFHAGIDIREGHGTTVRAVRDAIVSRPIATGSTGTLNEWLSLSPIGYVHLRVGRDHRDQPIDPVRFVVSVGGDDGPRVRVRRGTPFRTGDALGTINRFSHVHLNVGWAGEERNPLSFRLPHFEDKVAPTIVRGGIRLFDEAGRQLVQRDRKRTVVSGRVTITVEAYDQVDGNLARRRLGLFRLGYHVLDAAGRAVPGVEQPSETLRFDRLSSDPDAPSVVYGAGSGIPFYGNRSTRFLYQVTSRYRGGVARNGVWDTTQLPPGNYTLRVIAADVSGNEAVANRDLQVTIARGTPGSSQ